MFYQRINILKLGHSIHKAIANDAFAMKISIYQFHSSHINGEFELLLVGQTLMSTRHHIANLLVIITKIFSYTAVDDISNCNWLWAHKIGAYSIKFHTLTLQHIEIAKHLLIKIYENLKYFYFLYIYFPFSYIVATAPVKRNFCNMFCSWFRKISCTIRLLIKWVEEFTDSRLCFLRRGCHTFNYISSNSNRVFLRCKWNYHHHMVYVWCEYQAARTLW